MLDAKDLVKVMKKASQEANENSKPSDFCFGQVISTSPLRISINQKLILSTAQLILSRNVTDYKIKVSVDWVTENKSGGSGDSAFSSHNHSVKGKKEITIHNALAVGEQVILLKQKGGQKYLVLDRMVQE